MKKTRQIHTQAKQDANRVCFPSSFNVSFLIFASALVRQALSCLYSHCHAGILNPKISEPDAMPSTYNMSRRCKSQLMYVTVPMWMQADPFFPHSSTPAEQLYHVILRGAVFVRTILRILRRIKPELSNHVKRKIMLFVLQSGNGWCYSF